MMARLSCTAAWDGKPAEVFATRIGWTRADEQALILGVEGVVALGLLPDEVAVKRGGSGARRTGGMTPGTLARTRWRAARCGTCSKT